MAVVRSHGIDIHLEVQHNSLNLLAMPYRFRESAPPTGRKRKSSCPNRSITVSPIPLRPRTPSTRAATAEGLSSAAHKDQLRCKINLK